MANNASATVDLKILISVIQNQSQNISQINQQLQTMLKQLQTNIPQGAIASLANQVTGLNNQVKGLQPAANVGATALRSLEGTINSVTRAVRFLTGGFLAFQSVRFLKDLADTAARAEVVQTVLRVVARNAGITAAEIDSVDKAVQRLGITSTSSRESLTKLLQARLDLKLGPQLARASQDLAVLSGLDSSQTFQRLIVNIQQLDTLGLRHMGLIVDRARAEEKYKIAINATTRELTQREKQAAFAAEVIEQAAKLEGAYATAMDDAGKQLTSLGRLTQTYKEVLGNSLLPAYSVLIQQISSMFEKLIILGREFSSNKERAQSLADTVRVLGQFLTDAAVFVMKHLEGIIKLIEYYVIFRSFLWFFRGAETYFLWLIRVVDWFTKLRVVITALQQGLISFRVALAIMGAQSAASATQLVALSVAQTQVAATAVPAAAGVAAVGEAALVTTSAVRGLLIAWGVMAATLAIPVVAYFVYDFRSKMKDIAEKRRVNPLGGAVEAREEMRKELTASEIESGLTSAAFFGHFEIWKQNNPKLVADLKERNALMKEFNRQLDQAAATEKTEELTDALAKAKQALSEAQIARDKLVNPPAGQPKGELGEIDVMDKRVEAAAKNVTQLREFIRETFKFTPQLKTTSDLFAEIDKRDLAKDALSKAREDPNRTPETIAAAESLLEIEEARVKAMTEAAELATTTNQGLSQQAKEMELAAIHLKSEATAISDAAQRITDARKQLFGDKLTFTPQGVTTGAFGAALGSYQDILTEAEAVLAQKKPLDQQMIDSLKKGLEPLGQGAKQALDLTNFEKLLPRLQAIEKAVPGLTGIAGEQLATARLGVREERFKPTAEIVADRKKQAKAISDVIIQTAEEELDTVKSIEAQKEVVREAEYRDGLLSLSTYYNARRNRIQTEGVAELELAKQRTAAALRQQSIGGQTQEAQQRNALEVADARQKVLSIEERISLQLAQEDAAQEERRKSLRDEAIGGVLGIRAREGGTTEALAQLEFDLAQQQKKFGAAEGAEGARAKQLRDLTEMTRQAEIFRKERDATYQVEVSIEQAFRDQLDIAQQTRDLQAARDRAAVGKGLMTSYEAMVRENARTSAAMDDNRAASASKQRDLANAQARLVREMAIKEQELVKLGFSKEERARQLAELQKELTKDVVAQEVAVQDLALTYEDLAAKIETYGQELQKSFTEGLANALTESVMNFKNAGEAMVNLSKSIANQIVSIFMQAFTERLFKNIGLFSFVDSLMDKIFGSKGGGGAAAVVGARVGFAGGGPVDGPGTGTSDSIPAMLSAGEHIMPAAKAAQWMPVLEAIRTGRLQMFAQGGLVQSISLGSVIPRRYAGGGMVMTDGGASAVTTGAMGGNMMVQLHPEALNMTMRDWLEHEVVRQHSRR